MRLRLKADMRLRLWRLGYEAGRSGNTSSPPYLAIPMAAPLIER